MKRVKGVGAARWSSVGWRLGQRRSASQSVLLLGMSAFGEVEAGEGAVELEGETIAGLGGFDFVGERTAAMGFALVHDDGLIRVFPAGLDADEPVLGMALFRSVA